MSDMIMGGRTAMSLICEVFKKVSKKPAVKMLLYFKYKKNSVVTKNRQK